MVVVAAICAAALGCQRRSLQPSGGRGDTWVAVPTPHDGAANDATKAAGDGGRATAVDASSVPTGAACASDDGCQSQSCVEGVCCSSPCAGGCLTCSSPGAVGTCVRRAGGAAPRLPADCPTSDPVTCGLDGLCDGAGACRSYLGNVCVPGTCSGDTVVGAAVCNGEGVCQPGAAVLLCNPYGCDPQAGRCLTSCLTDADCAAGVHCQGGVCGTPATGSCNASGDCLSGNCVDHVCCNTTCAGPCLSCALPGRIGTCSPVASGAVDPRGICVDQGPASCGKSGTCDGVGGCALYPQGSVCAASSCTGALWTGPGTCDGLGTCQPGGQASCAPFTCAPQGNVCHTICVSSDDCVSGSACAPNGLCSIHSLTAPCTADGECESGFCAQGICCATKCEGACFSCALAGTLGTCEPVPGPPDAAACAE